MGVGVTMVIIQYKNRANDTASNHEHYTIEVRPCENKKEITNSNRFEILNVQAIR